MDRDTVRDRSWRPYDREEGYWRDRGPYGPGRGRDAGYYRGPGREGGYEGYGVYGYGSYGGYGGYGGYRRYDDRAYGHAGGYSDAYGGPEWMDTTAPGPHRGRGPRGYQRSDERICDDVCERLTEHGHIDASNIDVSVDNGEVMLSGTVDSRTAKRTAEAVAETVSGVRDVHNHLRIVGGETGRRQA